MCRFGGCSRGCRQLKLFADVLTLRRGFCSMPAKLVPPYRYLRHASQIQPIIFVQAAPPISAHALESLFAGEARTSNIYLQRRLIIDQTLAPRRFPLIWRYFFPFPSSTLPSPIYFNLSAQTLLLWRDVAVPLQDYATLSSAAIRLHPLCMPTIPLDFVFDQPRQPASFFPSQRRSPIAFTPRPPCRLRAQR